MAAAKPESKFAQAGEVRIHYLEAGSGEPVVCLHGAGPGASGWSNFRGNLATLSKHYRVLLPDLPGFGLSDKPLHKDPKPVGFNARTLAAFFDSLKLDKVSLLGNSAGGATSCRFTIDYPQRVNKIVLMGSAGGGLGTFSPQPPEGIRAMRAYFEAPSKDRMRDLIKTFVYDASFLTDELLEERFKQSMDPAHLEFMRTRAPLEDLSAEIPKIKAPTLLIWGADDRFVPAEVGFRFLRMIQGSELHVFSRAGHWVQVEHAERFNRLVIDFLSGGKS
jgi:2-hydroxy-6-oxonona-2,4-dienedioate hydrolase